VSIAAHAAVVKEAGVLPAPLSGLFVEDSM